MVSPSRKHHRDLARLHHPMAAKRFANERLYERAEHNGGRCLHLPSSTEGHPGYVLAIFSPRPRTWESRIPV